ncbi:glycosyltransferase [Segatella copri]|uniref:glycosyltransferase n=1 Tax=Segatella copri TaxID=165179 RepID=UPI001EE494FC|nr:glycosyltransferase [Segatella copri]
MKGLEIGGLEVVTAVLANKFVEEGHQVSVFSFLGGKHSIADRFDARIKLYQQDDYSRSKENVAKLRKVLVDDKIDIIINQWGLPYTPIKTARKAAKGLDVKIISVYHNAPSFNGRIQKLNIALMGCENLMKRLALRLMRFAFKKVTSRAMAYIYRHSDLFLVLSPSYIEEFKRFIGVSDDRYLQVLTNPITVEHDGYEYAFNEKQKEIIYVGRLDFVQKRVYRVIDTWNYLEERFPDWRLTIVGDGEDRENLENHVKYLGLKRVSFEGFQKPIYYYKRASILLLTSDFEGFPLVLAECMSFGVIPAVYNSYSAVCDIIDDGKDGIVLPYHKNGYQAEEAAGMIVNIMKDDGKREQMALAAIKKSKEYSVEKIYREWERVFNGCI